jgi:hypothetical protein
MQWDEDVFGLECDLDLYNIVATNDFNMGAMENKGEYILFLYPTYAYLRPGLYILREHIENRLWKFPRCCICCSKHHHIYIHIC